MHFCFVDESGTPPNYPSPSKPYFSLGAIIIDAKDWREASGAILGYKTRNKIRGEIKWRFFAPHNKDKTNPLLHLERQERKKLSLELAEIVGKLPVTILTCVADVESAFSYPSVTSQQELYHFTYKPITERFQYHLQDKRDVGIIVADHRGRQDDKMLRAHHAALMNSANTNKSGYDRIIEGLFLQDSEHSIGVQLADYVTGAIHRAYCTGDSEHATPLKPRIRGAMQGKALGRGLIEHPRDKFRRELGRRARP